jgi:soluble lytic murein transglycosylase-like protein
MQPKIAGGLVRAVAIVAALAVAGSAAATRVTVRRGDTLSAVAHRNRTTVAALAAANRLVDPNHIEVGQVLVIPGPAGLPARRGSPVGAAGFGPGPVSAHRGPPALLLAHPQRLKLRPAFRQWAAAYGVPADLLEALGWMESGWQEKVVSSTGAVGIGQLEPTTASFISGQLLHVRLDPRIAAQNIRMTARYLRWLLDHSHSVAEALAAYYQGLASVQSRAPFVETVAYAKAVLALRPGFSPG